MMLDPMNDDVTRKLYKMKRYFMAGNWRATINLGDKFSMDIRAQGNYCCYRVAIHRYMALSHSYLGRHDRAVSEVTRMIQAAQKSGDEKLISRSFAVLGRVHLKFAHLNAAAKSWQQLLNDVNGPILRAWLQHEIGRCHFEMSNYSEALKMSRHCIESSRIAKSEKWMSYGKLLYGQSLIELGHLSEALEVLKVVVDISKREVVDSAMVDYVEDILNNVAGFLQKKCETDIQKNTEKEHITVSSEGSDGNSERSNENVTKETFINLSSKVSFLDDKEQENHSSVLSTIMNNSILDKENSKVKSFRVIDKWKEAFCNGNHYSQSKFDLPNPSLNERITLSGDMSALPQILHPTDDTVRADKWTRGALKSKKLHFKRSYIESDWRKVGDYQLHRNTKFLS